MSVLTDDQVRKIAENAAAAHGVSIVGIGLAPSIASTGEPALEIKYFLPPGSVIAAGSSATVSQVIMEMADANDDRIPIVRYASSRS
jgi:hypothetical protein